MDEAPDRDGWSDIIGIVEQCTKPGIRHTREELHELVQRINDEGSLYFIRESGEATTDPWFVKDIRPHTRTDAKGREDTVLYILLSPKVNASAEEQYALGDFFANRIIGRRRIASV